MKAWAVCIGKLTEHQYAKLVIAGELLDIFVTTVFPSEIVEIIAIEEVLKLREHVFTFMHIPF